MRRGREGGQLSARLRIGNTTRFSIQKLEQKTKFTIAKMEDRRGGKDERKRERQGVQRFINNDRIPDMANV